MQGRPHSSEEWTRWDGTGHAGLPGIPPAGDVSDFDPDELQVWYGPPPNVQAGLFRTLAKIPGARVTTGLKDPLGRAAIGVSVTYPDRTPSDRQGKQEIFFDPESYAHLGQTRDDGDIVSARAARGVVNKPGARS